jgi:DNA-binding MarR family transcriptional regulator
MEFTNVSRTEVPPLIGALLRVPSEAIHHRLIDGLNAAGFEELRLPHMAVFQYPGPDGTRPSELAARAGMSKQAMNQLLQSLERYGYIRRDDVASDGRARVITSTERGRAVWDTMVGILFDIEREWRKTLGDEVFFKLKELLATVWTSGLVQDVSALRD